MTRKEAFGRFLARRIPELLRRYGTADRPVSCQTLSRYLCCEGMFVSQRQLKKTLSQLQQHQEVICKEQNGQNGYYAEQSGEESALCADDIRGIIAHTARSSTQLIRGSVIAAMLIFMVYFFAPRGNYSLIARCNLTIAAAWLVQLVLHIRQMICFRNGLQTWRYVCDASACQQIDYTAGRFYKYGLNACILAVMVAGTQILVLIFSEAHSMVFFSSLLQALSGFKFIFMAFVLLLNALSKCYIANTFIDVRRRKRLRSGILWTITAGVLYFAAAGFVLRVLIERGRLASHERGILAAACLYGLLNIFWYVRQVKCAQVESGVSRGYRRTIILAAAAAALFLYMRSEQYYLQSDIAETAPVAYVPDNISYDEETGIYTITTQKEHFKILQLTDIHLGGSRLSRGLDQKALAACYAVIEQVQPDLVVVSGDLVFSVAVSSFSLNNTAGVRQFAQFMRNIGIPWAFTYGNHDTDSLGNGSREDIDGLYTALSYKNSQNLLYPYVKPDISGRCNQLIEIRNSNGTLREAVFLIDSNDYTGRQINDYDYIHDDQVGWYAEEVNRLAEEEGRTPESIIYTHIPLQEYRTAYELYESGSDEVKYCFGQLGEGFMVGIGCSAYHSSLFDKMVELNSTHALFCGHDHLNTFSLIYQGIRLTYGMSIDYLTRPAVRRASYQRGGTVVDITADGQYEVYQSPYTEQERS